MVGSLSCSINYRPDSAYLVTCTCPPPQRCVRALRDEVDSACVQASGSDVSFVPVCCRERLVVPERLSVSLLQCHLAAVRVVYNDASRCLASSSRSVRAVAHGAAALLFAAALYPAYTLVTEHSAESEAPMYLNRRHATTTTRHVLGVVGLLNTKRETLLCVLLPLCLIRTPSRLCRQ